MIPAKKNKHDNFSLFLIDLSIIAIYIPVSMESGRDVYESVVNFIFKLSLLSLFVMRHFFLVFYGHDGSNLCVPERVF